MVNEIHIEPDDYTTTFLSGNPVRIRLKNYSFAILDKIYKILNSLLGAINQKKFYPLLQTVLKELVQNGVKAYKKRQYFLKAGIDININYKEGIESFKDNLTNLNKSEFEAGDQVEFVVEVEFHLTEKNELFVATKNLGEMTDEEKNNVSFMIKRGYEKKSVSELLNDEVQHKEGGGLGLSMIVVLMKSFQIPIDNLKFSNQNGYTIFSLTIPL